MSNKNHIFEGKIREYEAKLVKYYNEIGRIRGQSENLTSILGYVMIHGKLTQKELKKLTGYSTATISNILRPLVELGRAKKQLRMGTNSYEYSFGVNLREVAESSTKVKMIQIAQMIKFLKKKIDELTKETYQDKKGTHFLVNRLKQTLRFFKSWEKLAKSNVPYIKEDNKIEGELFEYDENSESIDFDDDIETIEFNDDIRTIEEEVLQYFINSSFFYSTSIAFKTILVYFITRKQLTQEKIQELTGLSAGKISQELNKLYEMDFIERFRESITDKYLYTMESVEEAFIKDAYRVLKESARWEAILINIKKQLTERKKDLQKLRGYKQVYKFLTDILPLMEINKKFIEELEALRKKFSS